MPRDRDRERTKRDDQREASYEDLMRGAIRSFVEKGYAGSRVDDIAAAAGHTKGTFYPHFKNKVECFFAVEEYRKAQRAGWEHVVDDLDPATTPLSAVLVLVLADLDRRHEGQGAWTLVLADFAKKHHDDPALLARVNAIYRDWHDEVERFMVLLRDRGWLAPDADTELLATEILAYGEGMIVHATVFGAHPDRYQQVMVEGMLRVLGAGS